MTAGSVSDDSAPRLALAPPQTYNLPRELGMHVWRLACNVNETRVGGGSESGLMEVAWELFIEKPVADCFAIVGRTFQRRGHATTYARKSYSLPKALVARIGRRVTELKEYALSQKKDRPTLWLAAEAAQMLLVELRPEDLALALDRFGVCRKRSA